MLILEATTVDVRHTRPVFKISFQLPFILLFLRPAPLVPKRPSTFMRRSHSLLIHLAVLVFILRLFCRPNLVDETSGCALK